MEDELFLSLPLKFEKDKCVQKTSCLFWEGYFLTGCRCKIVILVLASMAMWRFGISTLKLLNAGTSSWSLG
jgi:hypothetical protein